MKRKIDAKNLMKNLTPKKSPVQKFRDTWFEKGFELINVTPMCVPKMGTSGWCNDFNEPDETIHHIQLWFRDEIVANIVDGVEIIDDERYCVFLTEKWKGDNISDFIIFRKVKI